MIEKERAPSGFVFHKGLELRLDGNARLPRLELRALPVVHIVAVLELVLGEVLAAEVVHVVGLRLAVVGVHLRRQGRCLAQVVVLLVLTRRAGLKIHEMHALRANRDLWLRFLPLHRNDVRHSFSSLFGMCGRADIARLRYCKYGILRARSQAKTKNQHLCCFVT